MRTRTHINLDTLALEPDLPLDRKTRGQMLAAAGGVRQVGFGAWEVVGSKGTVYQLTETADGVSCSCPDSLYRKTVCYHAHAVHHVRARKGTQ